MMFSLFFAVEESRCSLFNDAIVATHRAEIVGMPNVTELDMMLNTFESVVWIKTEVRHNVSLIILLHSHLETFLASPQIPFMHLKALKYPEVSS